MKLRSHINKPGPLNTSSDLSSFPADRLRDAINVELRSDEAQGDLRNMRGTTRVAQFPELTPGRYKILGEQPAWGSVQSIKKTGVVYFIKTESKEDFIYFFDSEDDQVYILVHDDLGWTDETVIDSVFVTNAHLDYYVYFVDGNAPIRRVKVQPSLTLQELEDLFVQPPEAIDHLVVDPPSQGGDLLSGTYQFLFRYFNSETCAYSNWSTITNPVPVKPDGTFGGRAGQPTNKKITMSLSGNLGQRKFDSAQVLVIENNANATAKPSVGRLLNPVKLTDDIVFSSSDQGIQIDLADILIDKLGILAPKSITENDNQLFVLNFNVREFSGDPVIGRAYTIDRDVDYSNPDDCQSYKGYFRGETYQFGLRYFDENHGNSIVIPIDLSGFGPEDVFIENMVSGTYNSASGDLHIIDTISGAFQIGDKIRFGTDIVDVVDILSPAQILVSGTMTNFGTEQIDLLYGQRGNQGGSPAWTFGSRDQNQLSLFDANGNPTAIGLRIDGVHNHPGWAKKVEVVRLKRKKDIIAQAIHVPTVAVQGRETSAALNDSMTEFIKDYDAEDDTFMPKAHMMGTARNIYYNEPETLLQLSQFNTIIWKTQDSSDGPGEISPVIFVQAPEYLYNVDGESFDLRSLAGSKVELADAVSLVYDQKHFETLNGYVVKDPITSTEEAISMPTRRASIFKADTRERYFYNREGYVLLSGSKSYQQKISDLPLFSGGPSDDDLKVDYQIEVAHGAPLIALPYTSMNHPAYSEISLFGNLNELVKKQSAHPSVPGDIAEMFRPDAENQRGMVVKLNGKLVDFTKVMVDGRFVEGDDYFPLAPWNTTTNVTGESHLLESTIASAAGEAILTESPVSPGDVGAGAFILNFRRGLGPDRYGPLGNLSNDWESTGAVYNLLDNSVFDLEIWGGDCFITKHSIKVNDTSAIPVIYDPIDSEINGNQDRQVKTGKIPVNAEIIDVWLESEVNSNFAAISGQYPAVESNNMAPYQGEFLYYYLRDYSRPNDNKGMVSLVDYCVNNNILRSTAAWSDKKVRGALNSPLIDVDGYNTWRVNNVWNLDGEHGDGVAIRSLDDKGIYVFQEDRIAYQPVGVDEIRTQDGALIATGTGAVLGSGEYYMPVNAGSQHIKTIQVYDGRIYAYDAKRGIIFSFASRGSGFDVISSDINSLIKSGYVFRFQENLIWGHIDHRNDRYIIHTRGDSDRDLSINPALAFNTDGFYETKIETAKSIQSGASSRNRVFWVIDDTWIHEAYAGPRLKFFEREEAAFFSVVVNSYDDLVKVFQCVEANCRNRIDAVKCLVYDEDQDAPNQETDWLTLDLNPRNHSYYQNILRYQENGKSRKLRGQRMVLAFRIKGEREVIVSSIITKIRNSF